MREEFDVVCLGGGVAGEALASGLQDSGLTLAVVERELVGRREADCPGSSGVRTSHPCSCRCFERCEQLENVGYILFRDLTFRHSSAPD